MAGTDVRQLLLQVDASVAVAQRNVQSLARQVANDTGAMDQSLSRVDRAFARMGKSAEESAQAFIAGDRAAKSLIASIDPLFAAQHRYDTELERANQLYKTGSLSAQEFAKVQAGLKAQLDQQLGSFGRVAGASGSLRSGMQQLSFQIGDVAQGFALGVKPMTIFAQQGGQIIQTFQLMGQGGKGFISFLAGPWGIALQVAASLMLLLSSRHKDTAESVSDLVAKMKKEADQARLNETANKIWANSLDGVREAQRKLREEVEQSIRVEAIDNRIKLQQAQDNLGKQQDALAKAKKNLADLQEQLAKASSAPNIVTPGAAAPSAQEGRVAALRAQVEAARNAVNGLQKDVADSERTIRERAIPVARDFADAMANAGVAVNRVFDEWRYNIEAVASKNEQLAGSLKPVEAALERARNAAEAGVSAGVKVEATEGKIRDLTVALTQGKIGPDAYAKSVNELAKSLQAAADAAKDAKKGVGEFGKQVSFDEAERIAKSAGLTVTSGYRSTAHQAELYNDPSVRRPGNPVARPGTSAHEGVNGKWALDIAFADGLTPEKLKKIYGDQGVSLTAVYKERGHFHIEGSRSQAAASERSAQSDQARQVRNDNGFEEKSAQLDDQLLQAKMQLVDDTNKQADYAEELVAAEQKRIDLSIQNDVEEGKLTQAQADVLKAKNAELAAQKTKNIEIQRQINTLRDQDESDRDAYEFAIGQLRDKEALARTTSARKALELQILDLVYQEKQKHLETLKAQAELAGNTAEAARLQAEINRLPAEKASQGRIIDKQNQSPLEQWKDSVPQTADEITEAFQRIEVEGIDGISNALAGVISGTQSMGDAFRQVAQDIIQQITQMIIKMLIFKAIQAATGSPGIPAIGETGVPDSSIGVLGQGSLFTAGPSIGSLAGNLPTLATGGSFMAGGRGGVDQNILAINGIGRARVSADETIAVIPRVPKVSVPANNNQSVTNNISVVAPNTGNPRRDRVTALQQAGLVREAVATATRKGG